MPMRFYTILLALLFFFCTGNGQAQQIDKKVEAAMDKGFAYSKAKNYQKALETFQKVGEATKGMRTDRERQIYVRSQRMIVLCYQIMGQGKQAMECCTELIKLPLKGQEKQDVRDLYVNTVTSYVQDKMVTEYENFSDLRAFLSELEEYSVPSMQRLIKGLQADTWSFEALEFYRKNEMLQAYSCLIEAYECYEKLKDVKGQMETLLMIRSMEKKYAKLIEERSVLDTEEGLVALMQKAELADGENRIAEALQSFRIVGKYTRKIKTESAQKLHRRAQIRAVRCYLRMKRYQEAWLNSRELLAMDFSGEERAEAEHLAVHSGQLFASMKLLPGATDYPGARKILATIMPYASDESYRDLQNLLGSSWYLEGGKCVLKMNTEQADSCFQKALQAYTAGGDLKEQSQTLLRLGEIRRQKGEAQKAQELLEKARKLALQVNDSELLADVRKEMLLLSRQQNDMDTYASERFALDSLKDIGLRQQYYLDYGDRMMEQGDYALAEYYYNRSLFMVSPGKGDASLFVLYYAKMRDLKMALGDYRSAEEYGREYLILSSDRRDAAFFEPWVTQGLIYARLKNLKSFTECFDVILGLILKKDPAPRMLAMVYKARGLGYSLFEDWKKAYEDFSEAGKILAQYGAGDDELLDNLSSQGMVLTKMKKYKEARKAYRRCAEAYRAKYGKESTQYQETLARLGTVELYLGNKDEGCRLYGQAAQWLQNMVKSQLRYVNSAERGSFWNVAMEKLWTMPFFALQAEATDNAFTEASYNALLFSKSLLLETEKSLQKAIQTEGSPEDLEKFKNMLELKEQTSALYRKYGADSDTLAVLNDRIQKLDHELTVRSKSYADYTRFLEWDYQQVRKLLKDNELLVDFVDYVPQKGKTEYAAFLIRKDREYPLLLRLFTQKELDDLMPENALDLLYGATASKKAVKLLWDKIRSHAVEGATIYYVPSGKLYQLAWESLSTDDGSLLGEHYRFVRLSSAREIARVHAVRESAPSAVLYGGLQYDMTGDEMLAESRKYSAGPQMVMRSTLRGDSAFVALPESGEEVCQIADILTSRKYQVQVHEGISGTEESFLSLSGRSPRILHLATHGFYFTPSEAVSYDYLRGFRDAMYLSGLVLSGGNAVWQGKKLPEGVLGGILTAQDISHLDLSGTELVVLSACQSGQGKVTPEGLFGLQRAFKKAGAQTLVMTLWRVSDRVTREFMVSFYKHLVHSEDKRKAFEEARQEIRDRYPEPFYWAGFVMID